MTAIVDQPIRAIAPEYQLLIGMHWDDAERIRLAARGIDKRLVSKSPNGVAGNLAMREVVEWRKGQRRICTITFVAGNIRAVGHSLMDDESRRCFLAAASARGDTVAA